MLAIERRNEILEKLQKEKRVIVSELSQYYSVSEETIRRDLEKLVADGYAVKSYGGAVINESTNIDLPFNVRKNSNVIGKQKIAKILCDLIHDGDSIMMDASSTSAYCAKAMREKNKLTLITNSIELLVELFDIQDWNVMSTGGLSGKGSFALVGPQTEKMLNSYHVDKAIISCKGLDMESGLTDSDELHAIIKKTMLRQAKERILVVDYSKFDKMAFTIISSLKDIDYIVTDQEPEAKWIKVLNENGIRCLYPQG